MLFLETGLGIIIGLVIGIAIAVIASIISFRRGVEHRKRIAEAKLGSAEQESTRIVAEGEKIAEAKKT